MHASFESILRKIDYSLWFGPKFERLMQAYIDNAPLVDGRERFFVDNKRIAHAVESIPEFSSLVLSVYYNRERNFRPDKPQSVASIIHEIGPYSLLAIYRDMIRWKLVSGLASMGGLRGTFHQVHGMATAEAAEVLIEEIRRNESLYKFKPADLAPQRLSEAALLVNIGIIVMKAMYGEEYEQAVEAKIDYSELPRSNRRELEQAAFERSHDQIGADFLDHLRFPGDIIRGIINHENSRAQALWIRMLGLASVVGVVAMPLSDDSPAEQRLIASREAHTKRLYFIRTCKEFLGEEPPWSQADVDRILERIRMRVESRLQLYSIPVPGSSKTYSTEFVRKRYANVGGLIKQASGNIKDRGVLPAGLRALMQQLESTEPDQLQPAVPARLISSCLLIFYYVMESLGSGQMPVAPTAGTGPIDSLRYALRQLRQLSSNGWHPILLERAQLLARVLERIVDSHTVGTLDPAGFVARLREASFETIELLIETLRIAPLGVVQNIEQRGASTVLGILKLTGDRAVIQKTLGPDLPAAPDDLVILFKLNDPSQEEIVPIQRNLMQTEAGAAAQPQLQLCVGLQMGAPQSIPIDL